MKKALLILSACALVIPYTSHATSYSKKHHHKHMHKQVMKDQVTPVMKDQPVESCWLDNVSGTFDLATNYMFRGISQSSNHPAAQGGLTYTFPIGLYFNVWGSSVKFTAPNGATATSELDAIVGWQGKVGENFNYNINMDRYNYPGARYASYNELNTLFAYYFFQLGVSYSGNYAGTHASGTYCNGTLTFDLPQKYVYLNDLSFQAEMGHYSLARAAGFSYNDYMLGLNKKVNKTYTVTAQWTGTNHRANQAPNDDNQVLGMVTATF